MSIRTVRERAERAAGERAESVNEVLANIQREPSCDWMDEHQRLAGQQQQQYVHQMEVVQPQHAVSSDEEKQQTEQQEALVKEDLEGLYLLFFLRSTLDFCLLKPWRRLRLRALLLPSFCPVSTHLVRYRPTLLTIPHLRRSRPTRTTSTRPHLDYLQHLAVSCHHPLGIFTPNTVLIIADVSFGPLSQCRSRSCTIRSKYEHVHCCVLARTCQNPF